MPWQAKVRQALPRVVWVCLVLAIAAYGAVVVRNVTDTLIGIADHSRSMVLVERPTR
jgi:hypothetical protein